MTLTLLVIKELAHRRLSFALGVLSVAVAAGCLVGELTVLRAHDLRTQDLVALKERETAERGDSLKDDYRKITLRMGFNVLILHKDQDLADFYADTHASKFMPESHVEKLAHSKVVTIRHLLPSLQQKVRWPERDRAIILMGVRDEVQIPGEAAKSRIQQPVDPGHAILGHQLAASMNITTGQTIVLMGRTFTVSGCHEERGSKDDITVWIDLREAQELLDRPGLINGILALECECAQGDIAAVRAELEKIAPDVQVIEATDKAVGRAAARRRAAQEAGEAVDAIRRHRDSIRREHERFAATLVPIVVAVSAVWVFTLALANVRERRYEIGVLRAVGVGSSGIIFLFLSKACLIGVLGACIGYAAGIVFGGIKGGAGLAAHAAALLNLRAFLLVVIAAPLLAMVASWLPAMHAAMQDPAVILREE